MFQHNSIKARHNLHMNIAIACKENGVLSNVNNLLFAMTHCLETKMRQPRDDGIVEKWTQYVDSVARKCGSKNDRQSRGTTTHTTSQDLEVLLTSKESSAVKFQYQIRIYNSVLAFTSFGAKVDDSVIGGLGPYSFCIQGEIYHKIGSLCPVEGQRP